MAVPADDGFPEGAASMGIPVRRHRLDNGLRVVLSPESSSPIVAVNLWYGVGSRNEPPGRTGLAHLFEHMMFQGSANVGKNGHFELIERAGGTLNGSTWFDRTNFYETLPSHQLDLGLWLEADRMGWLIPALTLEKLDNQRDVVKNEKRQRYDNQPYGDWSERLQALVFPERHPYRHTVIGSMADLEAASLSDVAEFFRTFYAPGNAVLTVCGDFEEEAALDSIHRYFDAIPPGPALPPLPGDPDLEPRIGATVRDTVEADVPLPRVILGFRIPVLTDPEFYVARVVSSVLGSGRASRLYRALVREARVAKDVVAYAFPLTTGSSFMLVWATGYPATAPDDLERAVAEELEALARAEDGEVERALALAETQVARSLEHVEARADLLSMFELVHGDPLRINTELDRLRAVRTEDVRAFADRLGEDNRAIVTYVPRGRPGS